jgi:hypothetical protein
VIGNPVPQQPLDFLQAAIEVLRAAGRPLTAKEIVAEAQRRGLLRTRGKTPSASMSARLYIATLRDPNGVIRRLGEPGQQRAQRNSVRWALRSAEE